MSVIFWGGTFVAGRQISQQLPVESAAFIRFLLASLCLLPLLYLYQGRLPRLDRRQLFTVLLLGFSGVFAYNLFFFAALKTVEAGRASMIIASNPVFIAIGSYLLFHERFSRRRLIGILLSVTGAMVVISQGAPWQLLTGGMGVGELYLIGCVISWVAYTLIGKRAMSGLSPLAAVTYSCVAGTLLLLLPALNANLLGSVAEIAMPTLLGLVYLALFGTVLGFVWFYQGVQAIGAARAGLIITLVPVSGVVMGYLLLNEIPDLSLYSGGGLVIAGLLLANR